MFYVRKTETTINARVLLISSNNLLESLLRYLILFSERNDSNRKKTHFGH